MVVAAIKEKGVLSGKRVERRESGAPCQAERCEAWRRSRRSIDGQGASGRESGRAGASAQPGDGSRPHHSGIPRSGPSCHCDVANGGDHGLSGDHN
jgi:hypothetical protein